MKGNDSNLEPRTSNLEPSTSNFQILCWLVLGELALTILIFYAFTRYFA